MTYTLLSTVYPTDEFDTATGIRITDTGVFVDTTLVAAILGDATANGVPIRQGITSSTLPTIPVVGYVGRNTLGPPATPGIVGQIADDDLGSIYQFTAPTPPDTTGQWTYIGANAGSAGPTGPAGPAGNTGPSGSPGIPFAADVTGYSGGSTAAKITAAAASFGGAPGVVIVPSTLGTGASPAAASDISVAPGVTVFDLRNTKGTITNQHIKAGLQLAQVFGANTVGTPVTGSDNGSTFAVDALLTAGTGGISPTSYGENTAFYAGLQRQAGSTRSGWAANLVLTSYQPPTSQISSYGLEIDLSNNSGADAAADTPFDGISLFAAGTHNSRFGMWIANSGTAKFLKGVVVGPVVTSVGVDIAPGIPYGIYTQSPITITGVAAGPGLVLTPPDDSTATQIRLSNSAGAGEVWGLHNDGSSFQAGDLTARDVIATRGGAGTGTGAVYFGQGGSNYLYWDGASLQSTMKLKWTAGNVQSTVGAAGGASAAPATPAKWLKVVGDNGTTYVVPAYAAS